MEVQNVMSFCVIHFTLHKHKTSCIIFIKRTYNFNYLWVAIISRWKQPPNSEHTTKWAGRIRSCRRRIIYRRHHPNQIQHRQCRGHFHGTSTSMRVLQSHFLRQEFSLNAPESAYYTQKLRMRHLQQNLWFVHFGSFALDEKVLRIH